MAEYPYRLIITYDFDGPGQLADHAVERIPLSCEIPIRPPVDDPLPPPTRA